MASISSKSIYALAALLKLAKSSKGELVQIKEIASEEGIPQAYLEQILPILKNSGFVESVRGANGGYKLSKIPSEIALLDIIKVLEGRLFESNLDVGSSGYKQFLTKLGNEVDNVFKVNLQEILDDVQKSDQDFVYHI